MSEQPRDGELGVAPGQVPRSGPPADRVLIADDDAWDAELAKRLLSSAGLRITAVVVDTAEGFVEQLTISRPDVVLSDFSMPGFSGAEALRIAKQHYPDLPVIIWSGVLGDEAAVELIKQGATDYVLKDRPARLPSAVGRAIAETRQRRRLARIEEELGQARRLASLGRLAAAEEAVTRIRQMLDAVRGEAASASPPRPAGPPSLCTPVKRPAARPRACGQSPHRHAARPVIGPAEQRTFGPARRLGSAV